MKPERMAALVALGAVVVTGVVIGAVVLRSSSCSTCAEKRKMRWTDKADRTPEANAAMGRMINELRPKPVLTPQDTAWLLEQAVSGADGGVRGFAASLLPELVRDDQIKDEASKSEIREMFVGWLTHEDWSDRSQAVWYLYRAGFYRDPEILEEMKTLLNDTNELVRTSAHNVFAKIENRSK